MLRPIDNFNPSGAFQKSILLLQRAREGITALLDLVLLCFLPSLLIDCRLVGAAVLEEKCGAEEKQQGNFHVAETSAFRRQCQDGRQDGR